MMLIALLVAGCASHPPSHAAKIINRGERLIGYQGRGATSQATLPGSTAVDLSKEHLVEIYNGQQKLIERMEARQRKKEEQKQGEEVDESSDLAEGRAMPLSDDISSDELLRILEKQQSLIQALSSTSRN